MRFHCTVRKCRSHNKCVLEYVPGLHVSKHNKNAIPSKLKSNKYFECFYLQIHGFIIIMHINFYVLLSNTYVK